MLHVSRIGPIEFGRGQSSYFFFGFRDDFLLPPVSGMDDAPALKALAAQAKGHALYCDTDLARIGAPFGFRPGARSRSQNDTLASLGFSLTLGLSPRDAPPDLVLHFLRATKRFLDAAPWKYWSDSDANVVTIRTSRMITYEMSIMGAGGQEFGLALYDKPGSIQRLVELSESGQTKEARKIDALAVTMDEAAPWLIGAFAGACGLEALPVPMRVARAKTAIAGGTELLTLAVVLDAAAQLTPQRLETSAAVHLGMMDLSAHVVAIQPAETASV